ncbi:putative transposase [Kibdelosporangium phytohabitans]|nr:IS3 family transposase [Kibdelosporangium phytohabitans]MBE1470784.1 putative transposase [Kibdelosporangium phytohabitans]
MKVEFVDSQREEHGVQPVLRVLEGTPAEIAPSTYYAAKTRPESARAASDRVLAEKIERVHEANYSVYGARKVWAELNRQGVDVARCTVERLMRESGLRGLLRDKSPRTTKPAAETRRPGDLVARDFTAAGPNQLWVADLTYVRTAAGWVYAAFVLDVFSRWSADDIAAVAATLNSRPRKTLGWKTPAEALNDHLRSIQDTGVASTD